MSMNFDDLLDHLDYVQNVYMHTDSYASDLPWHIALYECDISDWLIMYPDNKPESLPNAKVRARQPWYSGLSKMQSSTKFRENLNL